MTEASDWAGGVGDSWAAEWRRTDRSFAGMTPHLDAAILAAAPATGGVVLDIGCGAGSTSIALAKACPDLTITGVDLSAALLAVARDRAAGIGRLAFVEDDVLRAAAGLAPLDLLTSRHGVMFFADPVAAFAALHAAAAPDAALVFSCFRDPAENGWAAEVARAVTGAPPAPRSDAPGPFAFADETRVGAILERAGWRSAAATPIDYRYRAGAGDDPVADAVSFFSRIGPAAPLMRALPAAERDAATARLAAVCAAHRSGDAIEFPGAAWIWSARA